MGIGESAKAVSLSEEIICKRPEVWRQEVRTCRIRKTFSPRVHHQCRHHPDHPHRLPDIGAEFPTDFVTIIRFLLEPASVIFSTQIRCHQSSPKSKR